MPPEHEQIAEDDVSRPGFDDGVLVSQPRHRLGEQRREFRVGPEGRKIEAVGVELAKHLHVPFQVQLADAVVGDRKGFRSWIGGEVQVHALNRDQMVPVGLDDPEWDVESLRLFDRLVAGDDTAAPIDQHRAAGTVLAQRALKRGTPALGTDVAVVGIWV